jgi:ribosome assembly protein YihI (activator of Der GTPase)
MEKEYKCRYCSEVFEKPLLLAQHVRSKHKKAKTREKRGAEKEKQVEHLNKMIEAIGILKGLQVSPNLSADEKKILGDVLTRIEELLAYTQKS